MTVSDSDGVRPLDPVTERRGRRFRLGIVVGAVIAVLAGGLTVALLLLRGGSPAGLHEGDCVTLLPQTVDGEFDTVEAIACDAGDARFRIVAVRTGLDETSATDLCQQEARRLDTRLLLLFAAHPGERGDALCVETL